MTEKKVVAGITMKIVSSDKFNLNWRDVVKGLLMAVLGSVVTGLYKLLTDSVNFQLDWVTFKPILVGGTIAGLSYLIKNFFTDAKIAEVSK